MRGKTPVPPNAGSGIQSFLRVLNFYQLRGEFIQKNPHKNDRFRFKVMNSPIYSIQREVLKEYEYLKSQICLLHCVFIKLCCCFFSFDISFFQITAKRTFGLYNQLGFWWTVCFHYVSYLPVMHDTFKAYYCLCYMSYCKGAEWNTLIKYCVSYLYYKRVKFSFWLSID